MDQAFEQALLEQVEQLQPAQQVQVLEFARELSSRHPSAGLGEESNPSTTEAQSEEPQGQPGSELLKFAGLFPPEDLDEIERAIEEGCESINPDAW